MTTLAYERGPEDALARQIRFKQELNTLLKTVAGRKRGAGKAHRRSRRAGSAR